MELLYAKNKLVKQIAKIENELMDKFVHPSLLFLLSNDSDNDIKNVIGIYDDCVDVEYVVLALGDTYTILERNEINFSKLQKEVFDSQIESYVLQLLDDGYNLNFMNLDFHALIWNFIDDFIYEVNLYEKGLYKYLNLCEKTGICYETLVQHTSHIICTDVLFHFYHIEFRNYGVILDNLIGNQYLVLGSNFDENDKRYYSVMLLNDHHEIIDKKDYFKLESSIIDYNNRFYDLKIKEHRACEKYINDTIHDHIEFLKERNEEAQ